MAWGGCLRHTRRSQSDPVVLEASDIGAESRAQSRSGKARSGRGACGQWGSGFTVRDRPEQRAPDRHAGPRRRSRSGKLPMTRGRAPCLAAFALALGPLPAAAQMPTVRIEFRLQAREYIQAFADTARRRLEDSATAMLVRAFRSNVAFLQFTASDSTPRVLRITLDQRDRSDSTDLREFGLRVVLEDPPMRSEPLYWK